MHYRTTLTVIFVLVIGVALWTYKHQSQDSCYGEVSFISITGEILSSQDKSDSTTTPEADVDTILDSLIKASNDSHIKAIVLVIDSQGGSPEASEEIVQAMKSISKPIYALVRGQGDSGAYWIASASKGIYAYKNSGIGSIGVTSSYVQQDQTNQKFISLSVGPFKDTGNPDKPITSAEKTLIMRDVLIVYNDFIANISDNRHLPIEKVKALADGSTMLGDMALQNGLIDSTGGWNALQMKLNEILGKKEVKMCRF